MKFYKAPALTAVLVSLALLGCGHKSPSEVDRDIANAQSKAEQKDQDANARTADSVSAANGDARDQNKDSQHQIVVAEADGAKTKAEGDHKVALAKCESLSGLSHDSCKESADANYDAALASIKQSQTSHDPTR